MKKKLKQNKTKQKRDKRTKQKRTRTERRNAKQSVDIVFVYVLLFIRNFKLWRKKFGTAPPYILRISDKYKQQTIVKRKKKERQKKNEWKEREKTKQASSFGNLRLEWSACESCHIKES